MLPEVEVVPELPEPLPVREPVGITDEEVPAVVVVTKTQLGFLQTFHFSKFHFIR